MRTLLWIPLTVLVAGCGRTPELPVSVLTPGNDTLHVGYADATQGLWLGGRRWAVVSPPNSEVAIVDFGAHTVVPLGATTKGALQHPNTIFTLGDTLFVSDWGLRRTTVWASNGAMVRSIPASDVAGGALPRAQDGAGRLYYEVAPPARADGSGNRDSAAVVRLAPNATHADTLGRLGPLDLAEVTSDAGRRFERRVFSGQDAWGATVDGSVWIARVYQNRVDWVGVDGKVARGAALSDRILEVTRTDRELFIRRFPPELRTTAEQLPFAPVKPPFERAFLGPDQMVWLEKSEAVTDSARRYHLVGRDGKPVREIRVKGFWNRALGASPTTVLVAEPDSNGYRLLEAPLPAT
jgi:hypothetical protein